SNTPLTINERSTAMQSTPILTVHTAHRLLDALEDYLEKTESNYAMIIERGGSILSELGTIPEAADMTIVAALAAGSSAATNQLAEPVFTTRDLGNAGQVFGTE